MAGPSLMATLGANISPFLQQLDNIALTCRQRVIVANPDEIGLPGLAQNFVRPARRLEASELIVEFLDIFPAWRRMDLADIVLDKPNRLFF